MMWSVSASKAFFQCPKKWYYQNVFATSRTKNPERKEAYLLKHLQSINAWRGKLVDQVITKFIVPRLNKKQEIDASKTLEYANALMESQLTFAKRRMYRNTGVKTSDCNYCALSEFEGGNSLSEESLNRTREEMANSLLNLINSRLLIEIAADGTYLVAQRPLQFNFAEASIRCIPDLIVFFIDKPPLIVDWKVEALQYREHWLQLGIYGVALSRTPPHKDFPEKCRSTTADPTRIALMEFQLLRNQEIKYAITDEDITNIEDYIYLSSKRMLKMVDGRREPEDIIRVLPKAKSPVTCLGCKFKRMCWMEN